MIILRLLPLSAGCSGFLQRRNVKSQSRFLSLLFAPLSQLTRHRNFAIVTILLSICATAFAITSCGTFKHTVRPPVATASSRSSSSTRTTTHHSFISSLSGPIGPTTKNDSMNAEKANGGSVRLASSPRRLFTAASSLQRHLRQHRVADICRPRLRLAHLNRPGPLHLGPIRPTAKKDTD